MSTLENNMNRSINDAKNLQISCIFETRVGVLPAWIIVYKNLPPESCVALYRKFWELFDFKTKSTIEQHFWTVSTPQNDIYNSSEEFPTPQSLSWVEETQFCLQP